MRAKILLICFFILLFLLLKNLINTFEIGGREVQAPLPRTILTSGYGHRIDPITGLPSNHTGWDLAAREDTTVRPVEEGVVIAINRHPDTGESPNLGDTNKRLAVGSAVSIYHGIGSNGYISNYCHLSSIPPNLRVGDYVSRSSVIGFAGRTGRATGPHLHYDIREFLNPLVEPHEEGEPSCTEQATNSRHGKVSAGLNPGDVNTEIEQNRSNGGGGGGDGDDDSLSETERGTGTPTGGRGGGIPGGGDGSAGGAGSGNPGGDAPDDNQSFSSSFFLEPKEPRASFFRLAGKKGKRYILKYWEYLKLMNEREGYFESIANGGDPDESYLESLNKKIEELYESLLRGEFSRERAETPDLVILRNGYFFENSKPFWKTP